MQINRAETQHNLQESKAYRRIAFKIGLICFTIGLTVSYIFLILALDAGFAEDWNEVRIYGIILYVGIFAAFMGIVILFAALMMHVQCRYLEQQAKKLNDVPNGGIGGERDVEKEISF